MDATVRYGCDGRCCEGTGYAYYGWSPRYGSSGPTDLPYVASHNGSLQFSPGNLMVKHSHDAIAAPVFYIMTIPGILRVGNWFGCNDTASSYPGSAVQCNLFNSTYRVLLNYTEGTQHIYPEIPHVDSEPLEEVVWGMAIPEYDPYTHMVRCPDLQPPHSYSRKGLPVHHALYRGYERKAAKSEECGTFNRELLQKLSYQAVFDAFTSTLKGVAPSNHPVQTSLQWPSGVIGTGLTKTKELSFLAKHTGEVYGGFLQHEVLNLNDTNIMGLMNLEHKTVDQPLTEIIEKLFQHATISLMSSPRLQ